jgi:hypothetical protein
MLAGRDVVQGLEPAEAGGETLLAVEGGWMQPLRSAGGALSRPKIQGRVGGGQCDKGQQPWNQPGACSELQAFPALPSPRRSATASAPGQFSPHAPTNC